MDYKTFCKRAHLKELFMKNEGVFDVVVGQFVLSDLIWIA